MIAFPPDSLPAASSLRVVILSDAVPSRNGVGTYYDDLAQHLEERVEQVTLLAPPANGGGEFRGLTIPMPGDSTQQLFFPSPIWLGRVVRELRPDVIISATPGGYGLLGLAMAATLQTAFCVGFHTEYSELAGLYWRRSLGRVYNALLALWDQLMFRFGSMVLVTNENLLKAAQARGAREALMVGTPVQRSFLERPAPPPPSQVRTVIFAGRLAPEKELGQVIAAADAFPELQFRIAGDGPLRAEVEAAASTADNLEYLGWVSREAILDTLDRADMLVLPSRFETFGTVAFEAMIRGRLALVSPNCGIVEWPALAEGLLQMAPEEDLTEALRRVLAMSPSTRARLAQAGMTASRAMSHQTVEEWVDTLRRAVSEKRFA